MPIERDCTPNCDLPCNMVFDQVRVRNTISQGTVVEWIIHPLFQDPPPYYFQLEWGTTANPEADDWRAVGPEAHNVCFLTDMVQRVFGKTQWTHYRVRLRTPYGLYYSRPHHCWGDLSFRDQRRYANLERMWRKRLRFEGGLEGYLLKTRLWGPRCTNNCVDPVTEEITNPQCPICYGTGFTGGFFEPIPCVWVDMGRETTQDDLDPESRRGTINDVVVSGKLLAIPQIYRGDIWVNKDSDTRWMIDDVKHILEIRGVPLVVEAAFKSLPFTNDVYALVIPGQFDELPA